jgi:two-component system response regulator FixJ
MIVEEMAQARRPMKTLVHIVEDDESVRDSLKLLLEACGYEVEAFASGAELFDNGALSRCACMIMDINLPGESGFEILARLRKNGVTAPAIFMSGCSTPATRAQAARAQAVAFFDKPVPPSELLAAIAYCAA